MKLSRIFHPSSSRAGFISCLLRGVRLVWASPNTLIGLLLLLLFMLLAVRTRRRVVDGVLEVAVGQRQSIGLPFSAITFGHVVLGVNALELERLRSHEHTHVRQAERWGFMFLPAYVLAGAWQLLRGGCVYRDNPFEVEARGVGGC